MPLYTLEEMCSQTREHLSAFDQGTDLLRDGMSGDAGNTPPVSTISITDRLNEAHAILALRTGYSARIDPFTVDSGVREYTLTDIGVVLSVYTPTRLRPTTIGLLNRRDAAWRSTPAGVVFAYYLVGVSRIGFLNPPDQDQTFDIYHIATPERLEDDTDTATDYPPLFGHLPALLAALRIARIDVSNPSNSIRTETLGKIVDEEIETMRSTLAVLTDETEDASRDAKEERDGR